MRSGAARALGLLGNPDAIPYLLNGLADPSSYVRSLSATALGQIGDSRVVPSLQRTLGDGSPWVRNHAGWALYRLGDNSGVPALIENLSSPVADKNSAVNEEAAGFLREMTGRNFGFNRNSSKAQQRAVIAKWEQWWAQQPQQ